MPVDTKHRDYLRMEDKWARCRSAAEGTDAVHAAGDKYLPRLKDQSNDDYQAYVKRTPFYNATWRTISGLVGMLFRQAAEVKVPAQVEPMLDDVTLSGVPMQLFAQEVCEEALKVGRIGILVDYPQADPAATLADAKAQNLRPTLQAYLAEAIINWRTGLVMNVTVLTMVVLEEEALLQVDEFAAKPEKRWRVLDLVGVEANDPKYRVRVFRKGMNQLDEQVGEDKFPMMSSRPLAYIPFVFAGPDDVTPRVDDPPLIDLVDVNLSHYRTSADLEHGAHFTGLPTPWIAGHVPEKAGDKMYIGSSHAWVFSSADAKAEYLEFKGEGLGALEKLKDSKEKQMAVLGARMLEQQKKGVETAEKDAQNRKGEESMLSAASQAISLAIEIALKWFADWAGADGKSVEYRLNKDFYPAPMTPQMLSALVAGWQAGAYSDQTLFDNLKQGEIIGQETTLEEEQQRIADSAPKLAGGLPGDGSEPPPDLPKGDGGKPKGTKSTITTPKGEKYTVEHNT